MLTLAAYNLTGLRLKLLLGLNKASQKGNAKVTRRKEGLRLLQACPCFSLPSPSALSSAINVSVHLLLSLHRPYLLSF